MIFCWGKTTLEFTQLWLVFLDTNTAENGACVQFNREFLHLKWQTLLKLRFSDVIKISHFKESNTYVISMKLPVSLPSTNMPRFCFVFSLMIISSTNLCPDSFLSTLYLTSGTAISWVFPASWAIPSPYSLLNFSYLPSQNCIFDLFLPIFWPYLSLVYIILITLFKI